MLGKELHNAGRGLTFLRAFMQLPSADKISGKNALRGTLLQEISGGRTQSSLALRAYVKNSVMKMQDEEIRQERYSRLVQIFAVTAKDGWSNDDRVTS